MDRGQQNMGLKILLVEPNDFIRKAIRTAFVKTGHYTIAVDSVKDGRQILRDDCFDVVISDFDLYDETGTEFLESLKDIYPKTTAVLMITYGDLENHSIAKDRGIDHVIEKPFLFGKLLSIVKGISEYRHVASSL